MSDLSIIQPLFEKMQEELVKPITDMNREEWIAGAIAILPAFTDYPDAKKKCSPFFVFTEVFLKCIADSPDYRYFDMLAENSKKTEEIVEEIVDFNGKNATMEDRIRQVCSTIDNLINEEEYENENLINEAVSALSIDNSDVEVEDIDLE
jgi:hypothetical protein